MESQHRLPVSYFREVLYHCRRRQVEVLECEDVAARSHERPNLAQVLRQLGHMSLDGGQVFADCGDVGRDTGDGEDDAHEAEIRVVGVGVESVVKSENLHGFESVSAVAARYVIQNYCTCQANGRNQKQQ